MVVVVGGVVEEEKGSLRLGQRRARASVLDQQNKFLFKRARFMCGYYCNT